MKINKKISILLLIAMITSMVLVGCGTNKDTEDASENTEAIDENSTNTSDESTDEVTEDAAEKIVANIATLKGPTAMGMINMIDQTMLNNDMCEVNYEIVEAPDLMVAKVIKNEVQIAAVPTNLAAVLYNKTEGAYQFLAENTLSVLQVVGRDEISSLADLEGKKVITSGKDTVVEYAINYILKSQGLEDKIEIEYLTDHASAAQQIIAGDADYAILPQPFATTVTMTDPEIKNYIDLNDEWESIDGNDSVLCMGCLIVNKDFYENNTAFVNTFLALYEQSVNFTNNNPEEASVMIENAGIVPKAKIAEIAIPNSNIVFKNATDAEPEITAFLQILYDSNPASVGGKMIDEGFFAK